MNPKHIALKAALLAGSSVSSLGHDPFMGYNFAVEIGGVVVGGFSEVSGLSSDIELESYEGTRRWQESPIPKSSIRLKSV